MTAETPTSWTLLGVWGAFEYWLAPDSCTVFRRKVSSYNYLDAVDGSPVGARYESSLAHFQALRGRGATRLGSLRPAGAELVGNSLDGACYLILLERVRAFDGGECGRLAPAVLDERT